MIERRATPRHNVNRAGTSKVISCGIEPELETSSVAPVGETFSIVQLTDPPTNAIEPVEEGYDPKQHIVVLRTTAAIRVKSKNMKPKR